MIEKAADSFFGEGVRPKGFHSPLKDGDEVMKPVKDDTGEPTGQEEPRYPGQMYFTATSKTAPGWVGKGGDDLPENIQPYMGDICRVAGAFKAYDTGSNKGVTGYVNFVKLVEKSKSYGAKDAFGDDDDDGFDPADYETDNKPPQKSYANDDAGSPPADSYDDL